MRMILFCLALLASPASAWQFSPLPICTLSQTGAVDVVVSYDPGTQEYAIALTRAQGWPDGPVFSIAFEGAAPNTIRTDRHEISGKTLTVRDRGFGNVLKGMSGNQTAIARLGDVAVSVSLAGAAPKVAEFEACGAALAV